MFWRRHYLWRDTRLCSVSPDCTTQNYYRHLPDYTCLLHTHLVLFLAFVTLFHFRDTALFLSFCTHAVQLIFFFFFLMIRPPPISPLFPSTTLFRSRRFTFCIGWRRAKISVNEMDRPHRLPPPAPACSMT